MVSFLVLGALAIFNLALGAVALGNGDIALAYFFSGAFLLWLLAIKISADGKRE